VGGLLRQGRAHNAHAKAGADTLALYIPEGAAGCFEDLSKLRARETSAAIRREASSNQTVHKRQLLSCRAFLKP
jgi:hypothetical protein